LDVYGSDLLIRNKQRTQADLHLGVDLVFSTGTGNPTVTNAVGRNKKTHDRTKARISNLHEERPSQTATKLRRGPGKTTHQSGAPRDPRRLSAPTTTTANPGLVERQGQVPVPNMTGALHTGIPLLQSPRNQYGHSTWFGHLFVGNLSGQLVGKRGTISGRSEKHK